MPHCPLDELAKQKAEELVNQFKPIVYPFIGNGMLTNDRNEQTVLQNSKTCATVTVCEIILVIRKYANDLTDEYAFWVQVLEEIQKL